MSSVASDEPLREDGSRMGAESSPVVKHSNGQGFGGDETDLLSEKVASDETPKLIDVKEFEKLPEKCSSWFLESYEQYLLTNCDDIKKRKKCLGVMKTLEKLSLASLDSNSVQKVVMICLNILGQKSLPILLIESLKLLRDTISSKKSFLEESLLKEVCDRVKKGISFGLSQSDLNLVDSCLEVLDVILIHQSQLITSHQELTESILDLWKGLKGDSLNSGIASSLVPLLLVIDLELSEDQLLEHGIRKNLDILSSISSYLSDIDSEVKESSLRAIQNFLPKSIVREGRLTIEARNFVQMIGLPISQIALREIDHEILSLVFRLWNEFLTLPIEHDSLTEEIVKIMYESGVFAALNTVLNDKNLLPSTKSLAYENLKTLRKVLHSSDISSTKLKETFSNCNKPIFKVSKEFKGPSQTSPCDRNQVLSDIFGDHMLPPTQDLIEHLISRDDGRQQASRGERNSEELPIDELVDFLVNFHLSEEDIAKEDQRIATLSDIIFDDCYNRTILADCF